MGEYQMDTVLSAVADPTRRAILDRLLVSDARVTDLASAFPISLNSTSKHIKVLEKAELVHRTVRGRDHVLSLRAEGLAESVAWMQQYREFWEQRLAALEAFVLADAAPAASEDDDGRRRRADRDAPDGERRCRAMTAVTVSRRIAASADRLFDAWLDPASLAVWMRRDDTGEPSQVVADPRVGGGFSITMRDRFGSVTHSGTYRVIDRPRALEFTWRSEHTHQLDSVVTVTFEPDGDATVVEVHHQKLPDVEAATKHEAGWTEILGRYARTMEEMEAA